MKKAAPFRPFKNGDVTTLSAAACLEPARGAEIQQAIKTLNDGAEWYLTLRTAPASSFRDFADYNGRIVDAAVTLIEALGVDPESPTPSDRDAIAKTVLGDSPDDPALETLGAEVMGEEWASPVYRRLGRAAALRASLGRAIAGVLLIRQAAASTSKIHAKIVRSSRGPSRNLHRDWFEEATEKAFRLLYRKNASSRRDDMKISQYQEFAAKAAEICGSRLPEGTPSPIKKDLLALTPIAAGKALNRRNRASISGPQSTK